MLYRSGYSYKDPRQECILAIKLKKEYFEKLLMTGVRSNDQETLKSMKEKHGNGDDDTSSAGGLNVRSRIQWDPERNPRLDRIEGVRSIQIGIPSGLCEEWIREGIVGIEDVTQRARELKNVLDGDKERSITDEQLMERGLIPEERIYKLPEEVATVVGADV